MVQQKISVTIIGLGRLGSSIGLALNRYNQQANMPHTFDVTGIEDRPAMLKEAESKGAISKTVRNLYNGVKDRDIVILALPYADVRRTYQHIGNDIRPGGVVLDFSPLKMPSINWAKEFLSEEAHLVGVSPVINPVYLYDGLDDTEHATADLFDNGSMMLMPSPTCIPEAVELASDFASLLGGTVHYMDPMEHDSLMGATLGLPTILGVSSFYTLKRNAGWGDIERLTNPPFGRLTHQLFDTHPDDLRDLWLNNRQSMVHYLDEVLNTLGEMRSALMREDRDALEAVLTETADAYSLWVNRRHNNKWDDSVKSANISTSETLMSGLMGGFLARKLRGDNDNND